MSEGKKTINWKLWAPVIVAVLVIGGIWGAVAPESEMDKQAAAQEQELQEKQDARAKESAERKATMEARASEKAAERAEKKAAKEKAKAEAKAEQDALYASFIPESELAGRVQKNWLENYGKDSFTDILADVPGSLTGMISGIEAHGPRAVQVSVQVTGDQTDKAELAKLADNCLLYGGMDFEQLNQCTVMTADSKLFKTASR